MYEIILRTSHDLSNDNVSVISQLAKITVDREKNAVFTQ